jgi:hypothetical protein
MPRSRTVFILLMVIAPFPARAQVSVSAPIGIDVQMTARMQPGAALVPSGVRTSGVGRYHRIVLDHGQRRYFAYDLLIEPRDASQALQIRVEPFSLTAPQLAEMKMVDPSWTPIPLLKYPLVPDVRAGDTVAIDLLENPATGQKVVDYLVFKRSNGTVASDLRPLRDFSVTEVELTLSNIRISVNGTVLDGSARFGGAVLGAVVWFYLPERGRFVMSLLPNPKLGFQRAGEVSNQSLTFTVGHQRYDIQSTSRIVPAAGRFNLYVLHEPNWRPTSKEWSSTLTVGAADRAELLVAR